jgi:uncharacterized protein involved in exopolysaccharide biosynthesis
MNDQEHRSQSNGTPDTPERPYQEDEVELLDILLVVVRGRRVIGITVVIFALLGFVAAIAPSADYTSEAQVIPESPTGRAASGGIAALQRFGINLGSGGADGLGANTYPAILQGREVRLAVVRDTFYFSQPDTTYTYVEYVNQPRGVVEETIAFVKRYTVSLPRTILKAFEEDVPSRASAESTAPGESTAEAPIYPTRAEERAMQAVSGLVNTTSGTNGIMTIAVTTEDPNLSTGLVESFIQHSSDRVRMIRTQKARENLAFIEQQFAEAERELRAAEEELAAFLDRNTNPQTARLRTERQRLERQVSFESDLYSSLQQQVSQARIDLQRSAPVFTTVEKPVPPQSPSGPNRVMFLFLFIFLGLGVGVGIAFLQAFMKNQRSGADQDTQAKLEELRSALVPKRMERLISKGQ